jgi:hypothetical protein
MGRTIDYVSSATSGLTECLDDARPAVEKPPPYGYSAAFAGNCSGPLVRGTANAPRSVLELVDRAIRGEGAGATGLEPATSGVTGRRSNRLSYAPSGGR